MVKIIEKFNEAHKIFLEKWGLKELEAPPGEYNPYGSLYASDTMILEVRLEFNGGLK